RGRSEGVAERAGAAGADRYSAPRPRGSQIGGWGWAQRTVGADRAALEAAEREIAARFEGSAVPRPPSWRGFRLVPERVEFWQGRVNRLHDRPRHTRRGHGGALVRLAALGSTRSRGVAGSCAA